MPLYEYKCDSCGNVFEVIQKFSDQPLTVHEKCGGALERLISTSALQFKGSGWYVNDYGKGNSKEPKPKTDGSQSESKTEKSNGSHASADSSGKSEKSEKSEKSSKSETAPSTASTSTKSDSKKSDSK
jgi:putative FmdB family regulatory protein